MPDLSFSIDLSGDLRKRFSELPQPLKSHLREGFAALSNIPEERYADLATFAAEQLPTATLRPPSVKSISTRFGVPEQEARSLLTAVGLVLSLLTGAQETTPEAFADAAAQTQVFPDAARGSFLRFADSVRKSAASSPWQK